MRGLIFLGSLTAFVLVGVSAASSAQTTNAATQARWVMRDLGTFGQSYSECVAINDRGQVVCNAWVGDYSMIGMSPPRVNHAFVWQNGKETKLTLGGKQSGVNNGYISNGKAAAINGQGQVVGWAETKEGDQHAFLWENGKMRDLGTFGGKEGEAVAVNDRGQVVGWAETKKGDRHAFFWENGKMADLTPGRASTAIAINNRGQVVVSSRPDFLWEKGKTTRIGTAKDSVIPEAINERGQVVGWVDTKGDDSDGLSIYHAFLWQNGKLRDLGTLGGANSDAVDVNDRGQVVGWADTTQGDQHAFLWEKGKTTDLGTLSGENESNAVDINERGQVVGDYGSYGRSSFVWQKGKLVRLPTPRGLYGLAVAINERGQIVGHTEDDDCYNSCPGAVLWTFKP